MSADAAALAFTAMVTHTEVLVANLPAGSVLTVHHPGGKTRQFEADLPGEPLIVAVPGDVELLGWGAYVIKYASTHQIRNGHHRLDRPVWNQAERAVRRGGIAYVQHEQLDHYGKARWAAVSVRQEARPVSGENVTYAVATADRRAGIVVCDDLGSARDLAGLLTRAAVVVSRDGGQAWEEVKR